MKNHIWSRRSSSVYPFKWSAHVANDAQFLKEKIDHNDFEGRLKSSKPISLIHASWIDQRFKDHGPLNWTAVHQLLEKSKGFSYRNGLDELLLQVLILSQSSP